MVAHIEIETEIVDATVPTVLLGDAATAARTAPAHRPTPCVNRFAVLVLFTAFIPGLGIRSFDLLDFKKG